MRNRFWLAITICVASVCVSLSAQPVSGPRVSDAEIAAVSKEIQAAEAESAKYSGGLVKATTDLRIATLKQTRAMLQQRRDATLQGIAIRYVVDGRALKLPADSADQVAALERDILTTDQKIEAQRTEAGRYSGGLVQALSLSTLATMQNTRAMLDQKRLALKYGLPQFVGFSDQAAAPARPTQAVTPAADPPAPLPAAAGWRIVSVASRVTEQNDSWWKHAWRLTLKNESAQPMRFDATIEFQDADGFVIDDDSALNLVVPAGAEESFTGYALVTMPGATKVTKTNAKVHQDR
jgi:hypothetical protein